jgi:hypothetical protein
MEGWTSSGTDFLTADLGAGTQADPPPVVLGQRAGSVAGFLTVCSRQSADASRTAGFTCDPSVKVGQIQGTRTGCRHDPEPSKSSLGLEYFAPRATSWAHDDRDLIELGKREIEQIRLAAGVDVEDGCVFRVEGVPDLRREYRDALATLRDYVTSLENLQTIGVTDCTTTTTRTTRC